ncbi:MAG: hypothetical protein J3K34DRAFT_487959, partial [Monoraphidium minutum]
RATGLGSRRDPRPGAAAGGAAAAARARAARRRRARQLRVRLAAAPAAASRRGPVAGPLAAVRPGRPLGRPLGRRGGRRLGGSRLGGRCRGGSRLRGGRLGGSGLGAIHLHVISGRLPHPPHAALPLRLAAAAAAAAAARRRVGRAGPARRAGSRRRRRAAAGRGRGADRRVGGVDGLRVLHCPPLAADGARVPHPEDVAPRLAQLGGDARGKGWARLQRRAPPALVRRHLLPEQPDPPLPRLLLAARRHVRVARHEKLAALPAAAGQREQQQRARRTAAAARSHAAGVGVRHHHLCLAQQPLNRLGRRAGLDEPARRDEVLHLSAHLCDAQEIISLRRRGRQRARG